MRSKPCRLTALLLTIAFLVCLGAGLAQAQEQTKVNINQASVEQLCTLKRIGPSYARRIVDYRDQHGPFMKPEDIMKVRGIGMKTFEANKDVITCE